MAEGTKAEAGKTVGSCQLSITFDVENGDGKGMIDIWIKSSIVK
jgi:hypothetical protein